MGQDTRTQAGNTLIANRESHRQAGSSTCDSQPSSMPLKTPTPQSRGTPSVSRSDRRSEPSGQGERPRPPDLVCSVAFDSLLPLLGDLETCVSVPFSALGLRHSLQAQQPPISLGPTSTNTRSPRPTTARARAACRTCTQHRLGRRTWETTSNIV